MKLAVVDFDGVITVASVHTHNQLYNEHFVAYAAQRGLVLNGKVYDKNTKVNANYDAKAVREYGQTLLTKSSFQFPEEFVMMIREFFKADVEVVIATHNHFPDIVNVALEKLGFTSEEIAKIDVISGFPMIESMCKNEHIALAMQLKHVDNVQDVILIDDSYNNCSQAKKMGCDVHLVLPNIPYFYDVQAKLCQVKVDILNIELNLMNLDLEPASILDLSGDISEEIA